MENFKPLPLPVNSLVDVKWTIPPMIVPKHISPIYYESVLPSYVWHKGSRQVRYVLGNTSLILGTAEGLVEATEMVDKHYQESVNEWLRDNLVTT